MNWKEWKRRLRFYFSHTTPRIIAGGPAVWIGGYLESDKHKFGGDLEEIQLRIISPLKILWFKEPPMEPKVIFRRKSKTMYIDWPCKRFKTGEINRDYLYNTTQDKFKRAIEEAYEALEWAFSKRIRSNDDFDVDACLALIASGRHLNHPSENAYRSELKVRYNKYLAYLQTQDFHKNINTDWSSLHPDAASLLHHAELWSETDPRMPQGNQFGKYVLYNFDTLNGQPLSDVLTKVSLQSYETAPTKELKTQALQTEIGLIFAYIKKTGTAPQDMVRTLLDRMEVEDRVKNSFWIYRAKGNTSTHFHWMQNYLTDIADEPRRAFLDH